MLYFTKMHGASNDFIVIDSFSSPVTLSNQQIKNISNRQTGIGADQVLIVEKSQNSQCDFKYRIFNNDGYEVEHCGNGARCFMKFVHYKKLTTKSEIKVEIKKGIITLKLVEDLVEVNMNQPKFECNDLDFDAQNLPNKKIKDMAMYEIKPNTWISLVSMGNPHAIQIVDDVDKFDVANEGKWLESHPRFKHKVNANFMQIIDEHTIKLRVFERGSGETLACGTGACASSVCGVQMGLLKSPIKVIAKGGTINILWNNDVIMQGDANIVFEGYINL